MHSKYSRAVRVSTTKLIRIKVVETRLRVAKANSE